MAVVTLDLEMTAGRLEKAADALAGADAAAREKLHAQLLLIFQMRTRLSFLKKQSPEGQPWAPIKRPRPNSRPLVRTGALLEALTGYNAANAVYRTTPSGLEYGTSLDYAKWHQSGTKTIPARPFLGLADEDMPRMAKIVKAWVAKLAQGALTGGATT